MSDQGLIPGLLVGKGTHMLAQRPEPWLQAGITWGDLKMLIPGSHSSEVLVSFFGLLPERKDLIKLHR